MMALSGVRCVIFFYEIRILFINKKVENKNVNPILACSCQQYRL